MTSSLTLAQVAELERLSAVATASGAGAVAIESAALPALLTAWRERSALKAEVERLRAGLARIGAEATVISHRRTVTRVLSPCIECGGDGREADESACWSCDGTGAAAAT